MGKFHLLARYLVGLLCAASAAFPALASTVSVDVSPTTGYTVTNRTTVALPPRTTSGPITTYNPTLGPLAGGGAYQTTSSGITITGINGNTGSTTMSGRINAGASAMRNGLTRCLTSFRCNAVLAGGAAGIQAFFNGIDWVMGEGGTVVRKEKEPIDAISGGFATHNSISDVQPTPQAACLYGHNCVNFNRMCEFKPIPPPTIPNSIGSCQGGGIDDPILGVLPISPVCPPGSELTDIGCAIVSTVPVPPSEIPPVVDSSYNPDPSDLPYLSTGGLDFGASDVNFEITGIPPAASDSSTFTTYPDGTSKSSETQFDFSWSNNPSKQPNVSVDETTTETTYSETGQPTGTTTTTTTTTGTGGGGEPPSNDIEIPTDCDFMPTVCRFLEWFQEPDPELSQEPDFTQLIDTIEIEREFQVGTSTAACPAPFQISLAWVPSVEVSLQPFCDLADLLRPFLLSLCFLYSGMIILRT